MANIRAFPPDQRPSALYLVAHQGPMRSPRPIEVQHMRIRRYMDFLRELRGIHHHYSEAHDIFVDFNFTGSGEFPGLMRLGEAIADNKYRSVFADLVGLSSFGVSSLRDLAYSRAEGVLRRLPIEVIDVSTDPAGVLAERMATLSDKWGRMMCDYMHDGSHDLVCFFPGLAANILDAVFFRDDDNDELVRRRTERLERENPYRAGGEPWLPDTLWTVFGGYEQKEREESAAARRAAGEVLFQVAPEDRPLLLEERLWSGSPRSPESLSIAEDRVVKFGFEKCADGQVVSFRFDSPPVVLFADIRAEGKIEIAAYHLEPPKRKRAKPQWRRVGSAMVVRDSWWSSDPAGKFAAYIAKQMSSVKAAVGASTPFP